MSVTVTLRCRRDDCDRSHETRTYFLLTKQGTFRLQGYADGWQVDGRGALCPDHVPAEPHQAQRGTWAEHDRRGVIGDLIREGEPVVVEPEQDRREVADALLRAGYG